MAQSPCTSLASLSSVSHALTAGGASAPSHNGHACGAQLSNGARRPGQRTILSEAWPGGPAGRCRQEARGGRGGPRGSVPGCSSENTSFWPPPSSPARVNTEPPLPGPESSVLSQHATPLVPGDENAVRLSHWPCVFPTVCPVLESPLRFSLGSRVRKLPCCPRAPPVRGLARGTGPSRGAPGSERSSMQRLEWDLGIF